MDDELRTMIEENRKLILENQTILQDNQNRITKIQLHIRRTMVGKSIYWIAVILITVGAIYFSRPYIDSAIETYQETRDSLNRSSDFVKTPGTYLKDFELVDRIKNFFNEKES